jgi:hypothetical protein
VNIENLAAKKRRFFLTSLMALKRVFKMFGMEMLENPSRDITEKHFATAAVYREATF